MSTISSASSIAAGAMAAAAARLDASAQNTANAQSSGEAPEARGGERARTTYRPVAADAASMAGGGVKVTLRQVRPGYFMAYSPGSPGADKDGMVATPDVDPAAEAVNREKALEQYRAAAAVMKTDEQMQGSALDISS